MDLRGRPSSGNITHARNGQKMGDLINTEQWRIVIHESEEGGYWGEVPAMPGCASEGATIEECRANVIEAARGCLSAYLEMAIKRLVAGQEHKEVVFA